MRTTTESPTCSPSRVALGIGEIMEDANQGHEFVTIIVDTHADVSIHRGRHTVADIKAAGKVPLAYELDEVVAGKLVPLADDGAVTIKGGERFVSQPRVGSAS